MIHLNRIKRTDLGAEAATHAGIILDYELSDRRYCLPRGRIFRLGHVDYLWRTDALALETGGTELVARRVIVEQDGHVTVRFG